MAIVWVCGGGGWEDDGGNEEDVEGSVGGRLWEGVWGGGRGVEGGGSSMVG